MGFGKPYHDPVLSSPAIYGRLLRRMKDNGLLDFTTEPGEAVQRVGLFTVTKKGGQRQRLIVDA